MFSTITSRIIGLFAAFAVLLGAGTLASHIVVKQQADDAVIVNLAGRQRMLTQKMTKEGAQLVNTAREGNEALLTAQREQLQTTLRAFETTLLALRDGGPAPLNLEMTRMRQLPPAQTPEIARELTGVLAQWEPFKVSMNQLLRTNGADAAAAKAVMAGNLPLMEQMNTVVTLMQRDSEQKVNTLVMVQSGALALGLLLVVVGAWVARSTIARPLLELSAAARSMSTGNLNVDFDLRGTREVKELGASFDRMRASMVAALGSSGNTMTDDDL
jgi:methyl-accepting chemotaxis protein